MILSGVIASSAGGFVATGGTIYTNNGYKYHVFTASGTFSASGEKVVHVLTINGGAAGQNGTSSSSIMAAHAGNGGAGGNALIGPTTTSFSGNMTVTVGAAGGTSSVSTARSTTSISGGTGGLGGRVACNTSNGSLSITQNSTSGGSVALYNTRGNPWTQIPLTQVANSGGGGGGVSTYQYSNSSSINIDERIGGSSGFNTSVIGSRGGYSYMSGENGAANSGAGGGGGGAYADFYGSFYYGGGSGTGGLGGSGIVIVAYQEG